jgi:hypothetical protein
MNGSLTRVPCTVVTGFLGAGKTTLIRHVIANAQGRRLAVIASSAMSASMAKFSKAAAMPLARKKTSSSLPMAVCAAPSPTSSCRRSMPFWRAPASSILSSKHPASRCPNLLILIWSTFDLHLGDVAG